MRLAAVPTPGRTCWDGEPVAAKAGQVLEDGQFVAEALCVEERHSLVSEELVAPAGWPVIVRGQLAAKDLHEEELAHLAGEPLAAKAGGLERGADQRPEQYNLNARPGAVAAQKEGKKTRRGCAAAMARRRRPAHEAGGAWKWHPARNRAGGTQLKSRMAT